MTKHNFLVYLQFKHCDVKCHKSITRCSIVKALDTYNQPRNELEKIKWCPRCDGVYFYQKEVVDPGTNKTKAVDFYLGGDLVVPGTKPRTKNYSFVMACDCLVGKIRTEVLGVTRYHLTDENRDWCYQAWRKNRIELRFRDFKKDQTTNPAFKAILDRVMANPTGIVERPQPPEAVIEEAGPEGEFPEEIPPNDDNEYDIF